MSRLPFQNFRPGSFSRPPDPGGEGSAWRSRREREGFAAEKKANRGWQHGAGTSKKGSRGRKSGIGRTPPKPPRATTSVPTPRGPGGASFPSVRLPDRKRFGGTGSRTQQARRSVLGSIGSRFRSLFGR